MLAKKEKEKKLIQREKFTKVYISLLTAVITQKGKLFPVYFLVQDFFVCNNCIIGSMVLQPLK